MDIKGNRIQEIDVIRGMAIFTMVIANAAPYFYVGEHPFWFRMIGTFAAPVFILIAAFLVGKQKLNANPNKLLKRGVVVILIAGFIDAFFWNVIPFTSFDVLYLLGFAMLLFPFYRKVQARLILIIGFVILLAPVWFQQIYRIELPETNLFPLSKVNLDFKEICQALFIDGWFPIFPWFGLWLIGFVIGKEPVYLEKIKGLKKYRVWLVILIILSLGLVYTSNRYVRDGYSELFYPPDFLFFLMVFSLGVFVLSFKFVFNARIFNPFSLLGKSSMFFYIFHLFLISLVIPGILKGVEVNFFLLIVVFELFLFILAYGINSLKQKDFYQKQGWIIKLIFGS
jgi:uncharacterized membrane protein